MDENQDDYEAHQDEYPLADMTLNLQDIPSSEPNNFSPPAPAPTNTGPSFWGNEQYQTPRLHNSPFETNYLSTPHTPTHINPPQASPTSGGNAYPPYHFTSNQNPSRPPPSSSHVSSHSISHSSIGQSYQNSSPLQTSEKNDESHTPDTSSRSRKKIKRGEDTSSSQRLATSAAAPRTRLLFYSETTSAQLVANFAGGLWRAMHPHSTPTKSTILWFEQAFGTLEGFTDQHWQGDDTIYEPQGHSTFAFPEVMSAVGSLWKMKSPHRWPGRDVQVALKCLFNIPDIQFENWFTQNMPEDSAYGSIAQIHNTSIDELITQHRGGTRHCCRNKDIICKGQSLDAIPRPNQGAPCEYICTNGCGARFPTRDAWRSHEIKSWGQILYICQASTCKSRNIKRHWVYKEGIRGHNNTHHKGSDGSVLEVSQDNYSIAPNHRTECVFVECPYTIGSFKDQISHIGQHYESGDWRGWHWREATGHWPDFPQAHALHPARCVCQCPRDQPATPDPASQFVLDQNDNTSQQDPSAGYPDPSNPSHGPDHSPSNDPAPPSYGSRSGGYPSGQQALTGDEQSTLSRSEEGSEPPMSQLAGCELAWSERIVIRKSKRGIYSWTVIDHLGSSQENLIDRIRNKGDFSAIACRSSLRPAVQDPQDFVSEVKNMTKFDHPHVVDSFKGGLTGQILGPMVQPAVEYDLSQYLTACSSASANQERLFVWFSCLISALHHIHAQGIAHQHIKPTNLLIKDGDILITDFSFSCAISEDGSQIHSQHFTGLYVAPEGQQGRVSDVFSLGCVFYEMTTILLSPKAYKELRCLQKSCIDNGPESSGWVTTWEQKLHDFDTGTVTTTSIKALQVICHDMTDLESKRRPTVAAVEEKIASSSCPKCRFGPKLKNGQKAATFLLDAAASRRYASDSSYRRPSPESDERSVPLRKATPPASTSHERAPHTPPLSKPPSSPPSPPSHPTPALPNTDPSPPPSTPTPPSTDLTIATQTQPSITLTFLNHLLRTYPSLLSFLQYRDRLEGGSIVAGSLTGRFVAVGERIGWGRFVGRGVGVGRKGGVVREGGNGDGVEEEKRGLVKEEKVELVRDREAVELAGELERMKLDEELFERDKRWVGRDGGEDEKGG